MTVMDELENPEWLSSEAARLRELAFQEESDAHKHRARADALELEIIERRTAANILRQVGLTVGRDESGVPWVKIENPVAPVTPEGGELQDGSAFAAQGSLGGGPERRPASPAASVNEGNADAVAGDVGAVPPNLEISDPPVPAPLRGPELPGADLLTESVGRDPELRGGFDERHTPSIAHASVDGKPASATPVSDDTEGAG